MGKSWELTEEQKKEINKVHGKHLYNKFIMQQEDEFICVMNFVNGIINEMIKNREITSFTQVRARIKSEKSVLQNDPLKAVDDVFGMEIVTATEKEYEKVIEKLKTYMSVSPVKPPRLHNKPNGYKATHVGMTLKKEYIEEVGIEEEKYEEIPIVEFQFKTLEVMIKASTGEAAHTKYKQESLEEVQKKYDEGKYSYENDGFFELPTMWVSRNGKMEPLDVDEILETMYPYLKMKHGDEKGEEK